MRSVGGHAGLHKIIQLTAIMVPLVTFAVSQGHAAPLPQQEARTKQSAQKKPLDKASIRVDVNLVLADATVKDQSGRVVGDLTKDDFIVEDNREPQQIAHFSRDELPLAIALVVDVSGSMQPFFRPLGYATLTALKSLKPKDEVAMFSFAGDVDRRVDLTKDKLKVSDQLEFLRGGAGGTNISRAVYYAARYLEDKAPSARRVIVLISDDVPTRSDLSQEEVVAAALRAGAAVYNLKVPGDNPPSVRIRALWPDMVNVNNLTQETGGEIFDVEKKDPSPAFRALIERLKTRYTIGFYPTRLNSRPALHQLSLRLQPRLGNPGRDYTVLSKRGYYYAPASGAAENEKEKNENGNSTLISASPGNGSSGPTLPFDRWLAEGDRAAIPWKITVKSEGLSEYQRLRANVLIELDGQEIYKRGDKGSMVFRVQFKDAAGRTFESGDTIELSKIFGAALSRADMILSADALVLPGEYSVAIAFYHTATEEHSVAQRVLHVEPLRDDPLPQAWSGLPPVEFVSKVSPWEAWSAPAMNQRFHLTANTRRPIDITLLANFSRQNMGALLLPALKLFSQIELGKGSLDVATFDLDAPGIAFEQKGLRELDWSRLRDMLPGSNPGALDAGGATFFRTEMVRRLAPKSGRPEGQLAPGRVFILLSAPTWFEEGADLRGVKLEQPCQCQLYYIQYDFLPLWRPGYFFLPHGQRTSATPVHSRLYHIPSDQLENMLSPLKPRVFKVQSPEDFRKALAAILAEISRM